MTPKLYNLNIVLGYWNENMNQNFRFNNPKQYSNWIVLVSFCSSHLVIKNCYNVHFMKIYKIDAKINFSAKNSKKFVYYDEELVTNWKFQTQLSRKLQRFRTFRKNKNAPLFIIFPNISFFHMIVNYWTGPLSQSISLCLGFGLCLQVTLSTCRLQISPPQKKVIKVQGVSVIRKKCNIFW
jgi:hypothetical protein